ncbi:hypothetical protein [Nonomuraea longispora]|nr:hypothetical protein [Nonomuraea longispora]
MEARRRAAASASLSSGPSVAAVVVRDEEHVRVRGRQLRRPAAGGRLTED